MPRFIAAVYRDRGLAERVIGALRDAGVSSSDISLAVRDHSEEDVNERDEIDSEEQPFVGLAVHSAWERLGWQGGARPAYRDRVPPNIELAIVAAGPLAIGLGGAQLGAIAGGVVGGITNFGFKMDEARDYYDRIIEGQAFIMVGGDEARLIKARETLQRFSPETSSEAWRAT